MTETPITELLKLATSLHRGNVGIRTGSSPRSGGKTHLFDPSTGRTLCGRTRGSMMVHELDTPLAELPIRRTCCSVCIAKVIKVD